MNKKSAATLARWHELFESKDMTALPPLLSESIVFRSPAFFSPYPGKAAIVHILTTVNQVFEDFVYHREFATADGKGVALEFTARVGDKKLKGFDVISFDDDGLMTEFEVLIRPASALVALGEIMSQRAGPELARLKAEAAN